MRKFSMLMLLSAVLSVGACAHKPPKETASTTSAVVPGAGGAEANGANGPNAGAGGAGAGNGVDVAGPQEGELAQRTIYFDFDSSELRGAGVAVVAAHARYLIAHPNLHVRLEGNTDDRGSREYNIGLGERRAQAVRQAMLLQGVAETQIATVSYGAERPAVAGHDEAAWSKNRRVDIVYVQ